MKYILDFDRVMFDVWRYASALEQAGLQDVKFDPSVWDMLSVTDFLYDDAIVFIEAHSPESLFVISAMTASYGPHATAFQRRKLAEADLEDRVSQVIVMEGDKAPHVAEVIGETNGVFVDDKLSHLVSVAEQVPQVQCIQMVRPGTTPESGSISERIDIPVVSDFAGVDAIIETL